MDSSERGAMTCFSSVEGPLCLSMPLVTQFPANVERCARGLGHQRAQEPDSCSARDLVSGGPRAGLLEPGSRVAGASLRTRQHRQSIISGSAANRDLYEPVLCRSHASRQDREQAHPGLPR